MPRPMEIIHRNIVTKISAIRGMLKLCPNNESNILLDEIETKYKTKKNIHMCKYFQTKDSKEKCEIVDKFKLVLINLNIFTVLQNIFMSIKKESKNLSPQDVEELKKYITSYNANKYSVKLKKINYKICPDCKVDMTLFSQLSEIRCPKCPYVMRLDGSEFDNVESKYNNTLKNGSYEPSKHCKHHLNRILAIKRLEITDDVDKKIKHWFKLNNILYPSTLVYDDWRKCLKTMKLTKLNQYIPYIMVVYSNSTVATLYFHERKKVYILFDVAIRTYQKIKKIDEINIKYYPYFIAKIIGIVLSSPEDYKRKQSIINNIHFQEGNTVKYNDKIWKKICEAEPIFQGKFKHTDTDLIHFH
jgi:Zn-finger nucleic acid-binding protein